MSNDHGDLRVTWDGFEPPAARLVNDHLDRLVSEIIACCPGAYRSHLTAAEFGGNRMVWVSPFHLRYGPKRIITAHGSASLQQEVVVGMPDGSLRGYRVVVTINEFDPASVQDAQAEENRNGAGSDER